MIGGQIISPLNLTDFFDSGSDPDGFSVMKSSDLCGFCFSSVEGLDFPVMAAPSSCVSTHQFRVFVLQFSPGGGAHLRCSSDFCIYTLAGSDAARFYMTFISGGVWC